MGEIIEGNFGANMSAKEKFWAEARARAKRIRLAEEDDCRKMDKVITHTAQHELKSACILQEAERILEEVKIITNKNDRRKGENRISD